MPHDAPMTDGIRIRLADPDRDAGAVAAIYRPAVERSIATFEELPPEPGEMADRIQATLQQTPWLVAEAGGVVGYAYAVQHRERVGYRWSVDVSAYVDPRHHREGIGQRLYEVLLTILQRQGFVNAYAGVALPNPASVALHERIGMRRIGVYERVGYKLGAWVDVAWFGMRLADPPEPPSEPTALPDLPNPLDGA